MQYLIIFNDFKYITLYTAANNRSCKMVSLKCNIELFSMILNTSHSTQQQTIDPVKWFLSNAILNYFQ